MQKVDKAGAVAERVGWGIKNCQILDLILFFPAPLTPLRAGLSIRKGGELSTIFWFWTR